MTIAAATGLPASVPRGRATVMRTASVTVAWSVALTTVPGEIGMTAASSVAQMLVKTGHVLPEGNVIIVVIFWQTNLII